jgi:hypothetical protein
MLPPGTKCGPVWRIAPCGVTQVYLASLGQDKAFVHSRGQIMRWSKAPMSVSSADLFPTKTEARLEYRRRRADRNPQLSLNLTSEPTQGQMFIKER